MMALGKKPRAPGAEDAGTNTDDLHDSSVPRFEVPGFEGA
jgi:hypothetical protein